MSHQLMNSFNAGELSPYVESRNTLEKYRNGCRTLENFLPTVYGPANRRPGTEYIGTAKYSGTGFTSSQIRLIPLDFSDSNRFIAEIGAYTPAANGSPAQNGYVRFWSGGTSRGVVTFSSLGYTAGGSWTLPDSSTALSSTPTTDTVSFGLNDIVEAVPTDYLGNYVSGGNPHSYLASELQQISFITVGNIAYLAHPNHQPMRISFYGANNFVGYPPFTIGEVPWKWPAMLSQNTSTTTITSGTIFQLTNGYVSGYVPAFGGVPGANAFYQCQLTISGTTATLGLQYSNSTDLTGVQNALSATIAQSFSVYSLVPQNNAALGYFSNGVCVNSSTITYSVPAGTTVPVGASVYVIPVTPSSNGTAFSQSISLIASTPIWSSNHVGAYWELDHINPNTSISASFKTPTNATTSTTITTSSIQCVGNWTIASWGTWTGNVALQASSDNQNWNTIRTYQSNAKNAVEDKNITDSGTADSITYYRIVISAFTPSDGSAFQKFSDASGSSYVTFSPTNATLKGWVKINSVLNSNVAVATVVSPLGIGTGTTYWYEGAFSPAQGYPSVVALHESRIIFGGTKLAQSTVWGSAVNDFQNFQPGPLDSNSYTFNLASPTGGRIQWIISQGAMAVGTTQDEWLLTSSSTASAALTPSNVSATKQSHYGSSTVPATLVNDTILYLQRMGRKLREFAYNWQIVKWISNPIADYSEQAFHSGIVEKSYQRVPDANLWMVRSDGQLVSMLYEKEEAITAFARHKTAGAFESVAVLQGVSGEDEIWVSINRTITGSTVRYIERFAIGQRDALDNAVNNSWWYVDAGKKITNGSPSTSVTGLSHLAGQNVSILADGAVMANQTVSSTGTLALPYAATNVLVGIPYVSTLCPSRVAIDLQDGSSQGRKQSINKASVKLYQSFGGQLSVDGTNYVPIATRSPNDLLGSAPSVINGWQRVYVISDPDDVADIYIQQTEPVPLTIAGIAVEWDASENY